MMNKILNQFRRLYDDKGSNDHDFTDQEERLRVAQANLFAATDRLVRSSEQLNAAALSSFATRH
jgi:hypothetical protein